MNHNGAGKEFGIGRVGTFMAIQASFTQSTSDHQGSHRQELRPHAPCRLENRPKSGIDADKKILVENEERLNRLDLAIPVLDNKIPVVESLSDRVLYQLIEAVVFALAGEGALLMVAVHQLRTRHDVHRATLCSEQAFCGPISRFMHSSNQSSPDSRAPLE
jgi:hypothetical protein